MHSLSAKDLYEVLGVPRDADLKKIRKAYRKLARETHPDLNPGDAAASERFREISHAWEVLENPEKRKLYDEFGEISLQSGFDADRAREAREAREAFGQRFGGAPGGFGSASGEFQFGDIDDLLGRYFGREAEGRGIRLRGPDVEAELELDFLDAVRGGEKRLTLGRAGQGTDTVTVRIPPGVDAGGRLRIPGRGAPGVGGGPPGDLWVSLRVRPHRIFRREGRNLEFDLPVTVTEAIRGAQVEVPTLTGRVQLVIPPGTHSGTRLRLRGKGVPDPRGGEPGDLFARVQIRVPRDLDAAARAALDALARVEDPEIRKELFT